MAPAVRTGSGGIPMGRLASTPLVVASAFSPAHHCGQRVPVSLNLPGICSSGRSEHQARKLLGLPNIRLHEARIRMHTACGINNFVFQEVRIKCFDTQELLMSKAFKSLLDGAV